MNENKITFIDGSPEEQNKTVENFLESLTLEERKRSMSNEFAYLDRD